MKAIIPQTRVAVKWNSPEGPASLTSRIANCSYRAAPTNSAAGVCLLLQRWHRLTQRLHRLYCQRLTSLAIAAVASGVAFLASFPCRRSGMPLGNELPSCHAEVRRSIPWEFIDKGHQLGCFAN